MNAIKDGNMWPDFKAPMLTLRAQWQGEPEPFGCGYSCAIGDTVTAGPHPRYAASLAAPSCVLTVLVPEGCAGSEAAL